MVKSAAKKPDKKKAGKGSSKEDAADLLTTFSAAATIFDEGDPGDLMYIVESGEVEILKGQGPRQRRLTVLEAGDFFGEMSVLESQPRTATAKAQSNCSLLTIDASTFDHMLREHPEITVRIMRKLSRRLREYEEADRRAQKVAAGVLSGAQAENAAVEKLGTDKKKKKKRGATLKISPPEEKTPPPPPEKPPPEKPAPPPVVEEAPPPPEKPAATSVTGALAQIDGPAFFPIVAGSEKVIGRFDPVTRQSPEIDLTELDTQRSMSRRHARIWLHDGRFFVQEEIGVGNGTYLERTRLSSGKPYEIRHGQRLKLGLVELELRVDPAGS